MASSNEHADYYCALLRAMRDGKSDLTPDIHANEREAIGWVLSVADNMQAELKIAIDFSARISSDKVDYREALLELCKVAPQQSLDSFPWMAPVIAKAKQQANQ